MSLKEIFTGIFLGIVLLLGIGLVWLWNFLGGMCGETLLQTVISPDASKAIYKFESGCGATTPNKYHYFLDTKGQTNLTEMKELKKRNEFFQHVRGGSQAKWTSENQIELVFWPQPGRDSWVKKRKSQIRDTQINILEKTQ